MFRRQKLTFMDKNKNVFDNVLQLIGSTPLIKLNKMTSDFDGDFFAQILLPCCRHILFQKLRRRLPIVHLQGLAPDAQAYQDQ